MRLGDQSIMANILFNIKRKLISLYPKRFNQENLYFKYDNDISKNLVGINDLIKYGPGLFDGPSVTLPSNIVERYNINQIQPRFHNWKVNAFYRRQNWTLSDTAFPHVPLVPQLINHYNGMNKDRVLILPTTGKTYHVERNQTNRMIINMINSLPSHYNNIYIINKDVYRRNLTDIERGTDRNITLLGDDQYWNEIVDIATQLCDVYISGDCGFSHLLANMYNSPNNFINFYRTRRSRDTMQYSSWRKCVVNKPDNEKILKGIDNLFRIDQRLQSIYKRNVIFQNNQDGRYLAKNHQYYGQQI